MTKKPEEKPTEEVLEENPNKVTETDEGGVEVSVEDDNPQKEPIVQERKEEVAKPAKQDPITNKVYAHDRILSNVQKSIEELKNIMLSNASSISPAQEEKLDELDKLAQTDWKAAVSKIVEARTHEILDKERKQIETQKVQEESSQIMEKNATFVTSKHAELNDATSEKAQIFQEVLNNNPRWRTSPDGPLLTMYAMEDELRKRGYQVDGVAEKKPEANRVIPASGLPSSRPVNTGNKIVLTREQREFCEQNGLSYEDYARTLRKSGEREGISI